MYLVSWRILNWEKITNKMVGMMRTPATRQITGEIKNIFMFVPDGVRDHSSSKRSKVVESTFEELLKSVSLGRIMVPLALLTEAQPGRRISFGFWDECLTWRKQDLLCWVLRKANEAEDAKSPWKQSGFCSQFYQLSSRTESSSLQVNSVMPKDGFALKRDFLFFLQNLVFRKENDSLGGLK